MSVAYEPWIVALSILVAIQGTYVTLGLAVKIGQLAGLARRAALTVIDGYVAFVGFHRKAASLREVLARTGVDAERLGRLRAPAGLDLGAVTPEEIALSIVAEIIEVRRRGQTARHTGT